MAGGGGGDAGQHRQGDAGRRERVADPAFEGGVLRVEGRLEPGSGAEIGARGHDAEDAGEPGHAHGVGRTGRLSRVADDRSSAPTKRPKEADLERLKQDRGSMPCETPETPCGQGQGGIAAAGIETAGVSC